MTAVNLNRSYYPALDGLRGVAILLVVLFHNFGFINYFFFGWLGVDLFFVLSGFLITDILLKTFNRPDYLRNFYARRILRIFPLYYLSLIIFLFILPNIYNPPVDFTYYINNQWWLWTYLQNWLYIFEPSRSGHALNHLWSLAVEEQFYLVWPLVILLLRKPKYLLVLISFVLLAVMALRFIIWTYQLKELAYYNLYTFTRIDGLCIGCMVALIHRINFNFLNKNTAIVVFTLAGMNFLFYFFNRYYDFSFPYLAIVGYTTFAAVFGILVHEAVTDNKVINFIFTNRVLSFFGKISYGFYVFHWPVFLCLSPFLKSYAAEILPAAYVSITTAIAATAIGLLISIVSYYTFEAYFLRLKKYF
jgi:peptidoglycan/LPS O-acetylase OafA/YrhL